jgi:hypothetical protein
MLCKWDRPEIGDILVGIEHRAFTIYCRDVGPELLGTLATAVPEVESKNLVGLFIGSGAIRRTKVRESLLDTLLKQPEPRPRPAEYALEGSRLVRYQIDLS